MEKDEYIRRFDLAARSCLEFARTCVIEDLPDNILFDVALNRQPDVRGKIKYVGGRLLDSVSIRSVPYVKARKMFWVEGKVPRWINMQVTRVDGDASIIEVTISDVLISDEVKLFHRGDGNPPFHILGPSRPFVKDVKYSLHSNHEQSRFSRVRRSLFSILGWIGKSEV